MLLRPPPSRILIQVLLIILIASSMTQPYTFNILGSGIVAQAQGQDDPATWTPLDTSEYSVDVVGEKTGSLQGQPFAGWYTDTVVVDKDTGTIVIAWARWNADSEGNDYIYLAFFKPVDADGDGSPEAYQKIIKLVDYTRNLKSLDSLTIGTINGQKYVLLTWTYYDPTEKNNVAGAVYSIDGVYQWSGNIRSTTYYEEYSRSCYVPAYNSDSGGFLIVWYTSYDNSIDGKWLYYSGAEWKLSNRFDIADTGLYYDKADQMLCIGGNSRALVVYRVWDPFENKPELRAALIDANNNNSIVWVFLYDYNGVEETVGVRGAYTSGYFIVPLVSGTYVRYDIVEESTGDVWHRDYVTSNGEHPYAIALNDRFVLAWIDHYRDDDGEPKIANIDLNNFYIHPQYGVSVTGGDSYYDKHPIIAPLSDGKLLYVWSSSNDGSTYDIKYAIISLGTPTSNPSVISRGILVSGLGDQRAHGLGVVSDNEYVVAYTDTSDGEEDLLAYVALPDTEEVSTITLYKLPGDANAYKQKILDLINNANNKVYVAVSFFREDNPGGEDTISKALVDAKNRGVDVRVIIDDDPDNKLIYNYLVGNGVPVINDSSLNDPIHIMHDKFMVIDGDKVIVATANFGASEFYGNNDTAMYIESKAVAYFYEKEFLQMWNNGNGRFGIQKTEDYSFIAFTTYSGRTIVFEGYFSPQNYGVMGRIPETIAGYINRAESSVYFSSYIFTTSWWVTPIYNAIVNAYSNGKTVKGVFDEELNVDTPGKRLYWFIDDNILVAIDNHPYKMHAKLFVIDNKIAIIGSWNPTKTATKVHDENILIIRDPNTIEGFAKQIADYILSMYNSNIFVKSPYRYKPTHLVIAKVMFKPDNSGSPDKEWVQIYNPTSETIDLTNYLIGDAENLLEGDNEGMYKFPEGARIEPGRSVFIAYSATVFYEVYGFKPDYEIIDSDPDVPDLIPFDESKFTGSWNLDDSGDEVLLVYNDDGYLRVVDAVWYGSSSYMETSIGRPESAEPLDISDWENGYGIVDKAVVLGDDLWDALRMNDKYTLGNLSNTPAVLSVALVNRKTLVASVTDPDPYGAVVDNISIGVNIVESNTVDLVALGLDPGVYDVVVKGHEETPIGTGYRSLIVSSGLGVAIAPNGEKVYCLALGGGITRVSYEYPKVDEHRIVITGSIGAGKVNITIPDFWNTSSIEVYVDGSSHTYTLYEDKGIVSIELDAPATNITVKAKTSPNREASLRVELTGMAKLNIEAYDPDADNGYMWLWVYVNETLNKTMEGSRTLNYTLELNESQKALYNVTVVLVERTPSYVNITYQTSLWVAVVPGNTTIATSETPIISYRFIRINNTHEKIEILINGTKTMVNVIMPSNWERVEAVYVDGIKLPEDNWSISNGIILVDPENNSNVTIIGVLKAPPTITPTGTPLGGYAKPYPGVILLLAVLIIVATILYFAYGKLKPKSSKS